jgi:uncharacterized membrane-anchored protein YitT (DUF2179 family)
MSLRAAAPGIDGRVINTPYRPSGSPPIVRDIKKRKLSTKEKQNTEENQNMIALLISPMFAAAGYSLIYILGGGGLFGAIVIFFIAKMFGK